MSHTPHELAEDFPDHVEKMHDLKETDAHFAKLTEAYHIANRAIHVAETNIEPVSDDHITQLRIERMRLKDEIYAYLRDA